MAFLSRFHELDNLRRFNGTQMEMGGYRCYLLRFLRLDGCRIGVFLIESGKTMSDQLTNQIPANYKLWRTHSSVLKATYPVTEKLEKTANTLVKKYFLGGHEVMEDRFIANLSDDKESCDVQFYSQALGSFRGDLRNQIFTLTREQFEYLKEIWK